MLRSYSNKDYLQQVARSIQPALAFEPRGRENWALWRQELRVKLIELMGGFPRKASLHPETMDATPEHGYIRETVTFQAEAGVWVSAYCLIPDGLTGRVPAILCLHGHGGPGGKAYPAGVADDEEARQTITQYRYDYAAQLTRRGYVTLVPDARGFGDRRDGSEHGCDIPGIVSTFLGRTLTGMRAFDDMRALDYLETRPEVDARRIGCTGLSEGGKRTLYLAALDDRVAVAVVSGYFTSLRYEILDWENLGGWDVCNHIFGLLTVADLPDIAALIAPRPLLFENGTRDPLFSPSGVEWAYEQVARAYQFLFAGDKIGIDRFDGEHRYHGERAFAWFDRWLA